MHTVVTNVHMYFTVYRNLPFICYQSLIEYIYFFFLNRKEKDSRENTIVNSYNSTWLFCGGCMSKLAASSVVVWKQQICAEAWAQVSGQILWRGAWVK